MNEISNSMWKIPCLNSRPQTYICVLCHNNLLPRSANSNKYLQHQPLHYTTHNLLFTIVTFFLFRNSLCHLLHSVVHLYCAQHKNLLRFLNSIFFVQLSNSSHITPLLFEPRKILNCFSSSHFPEF